jgi:hypothetical protein
MAGRFNGTLESLGISLQGPVPDIYLIENNVPLSAGFVLLSSVIVLLMQLGCVATSRPCPPAPGSGWRPRTLL